MQRAFRAAATAAALLSMASGDARAQQTPLSRPPLPSFQDTNPPAPAARPQPAPRRTEPPREEAPRARRAPLPPVTAPAAVPRLESAALGRDLDAALEIDAGARAIRGQRDAIRARDAQVRSPIAGSPALGGSFRSDTRGPRVANEWDVEFGAPLWLPGQRGALAGTVTAGVEEQARRLALRRLELAGLLRDAYWAVGLAVSELGVARDRLATARDIARDVSGGSSWRHPETEGCDPQRGAGRGAGPCPGRGGGGRGARHYRTADRRQRGGAGDRRAAPSGGAPARPWPMAPATRRWRAAESWPPRSRARLVAATPIDNPELGLFTRGQGGPVTENGTSLGMRVRIPLPTEARNTPRRADAEFEWTRAEGELIQTRRVVAGEVGRPGWRWRPPSSRAGWPPSARRWPTGRPRRRGVPSAPARSVPSTCSGCGSCRSRRRRWMRGRRSMSAGPAAG